MSSSDAFEITDVQVKHVDSSDGILRAHVSIEFNGVLAVHNLKVIEGPDGLFVAMPARRTKNGCFADLVRPTQAAALEAVEAAILAAYRDDDWPPEGAGVGARIIPPPDNLLGNLARDLPRDAA